MKKFWLMKCEPQAYSIDDLASEQITFWEGVRNYQARNFLRDEMKKGDLAFYYHSNAKPSGIVGLVEVCSESYPDRTALDPQSKYFDERSSLQKPIWYGVEVRFLKKFPTLISLNDLRKIDGLEKMGVLQKGSRLSIQPVAKEEFELIRGTYGY